MQEIMYKKIIENINSKDILRIICALFIIFQALLFIVDDSFHIFKNTSNHFLYAKFFINYFASSIFLLTGLFLFIGLKIKLQIILSLILLIISFLFLYINQELTITSIIVPSIIFIIGLCLLTGNAGNVSVDKLF